MKVNSKNIRLIKERLKRLYKDFDIIPLDESDDVKIGDEYIYIQYPDDELDEGVSVDEFLDYTSDLDNLVMEDSSTVRMNAIRQTILNLDVYHYDYLVPEVSYNEEILSLEIVENPVLVGLIASKEGIYNEEFGVYPCSRYIAVELRYKTEKRYSREKEDHLIKSYLYYIATKYDVSLDIGEFDYWEDFTGEEKPDAYQLEEGDLVYYTGAMEYYSNALRINDPDIQFHHLYKIIEHFSPVVSRKKAYESLNQKLDTLTVVSRDYHYLDSLLELAKHYEISLKDKELCKTVLMECVDVVALFGLLPSKVQDAISQKCSFKIKDIDKCSAAEVSKIKVELGEIIYATRNRIVHAKTNWDASEKACDGEDMLNMNVFMKALAQCLIVWNGRQPEEFRV